MDALRGSRLPGAGIPRVQIISTVSEPLFTLVEAGTFLADLYYRLNIVRMDLTPSSEANP